MVDLSREPIGRKPFRHGIGVKKRSIDPFGRCAEHAMKLHSTHSHDFPPSFASVNILARWRKKTNVGSMDVPMSLLLGYMRNDGDVGEKNVNYKANNIKRLH
jgi:hypothetical protein